MSASAAFELLNPDGAAPVLLVCDHASRVFPEHLGTLGVAEPDTFEHIAWDIGAADLTRGLSQALDAPAVLCRWSRLVVDCNRRLDDPSAFVEMVDGVRVPGNASMTTEDRNWRIEAIHAPYHAAIDAQLDVMQARGVMPAFVSVHSFTPLLGEAARPWHVGILWDRDDRLPAPVLASLRAVEGLHVGDNEPYSGRHPTDFTLHAHAVARGLPYVGFEVRQDLLATAGGIRYWVDLLERAVRAGLQAADHDLLRPPSPDQGRA
jgi:predicted N-formylglutamate amidohydrolase